MFINPEQIIKKIGIKYGYHVADFGSGAGAYAIPLAKAVGPNGKVYALDVRQEMLDMVRAKAREGRVLNISTLRVDLEQENGSGLAENSMDLAVISNILFQLDDQSATIKEAFRILKKGGTVALIDWSSKGYGRVGPQPEKQLNKQNAEKLLENTGFKRIKEFDAGLSHYGLLYQKP